MLGGILTIISIVARDIDRAVAIQLDSMEQMRGVLTSTIAICPTELAQQLAADWPALPETPADYAVSALEQSLDRYREKLVLAQDWLERTDQPQASELLTRIWEFLVKANEGLIYDKKPW
jgi:hypothetical protein